jgi:CRISPR-associated protein Cas2
MVVMILENVQPSVRGELTRWMLELRSGVFLGDLSAAVRDKLWQMVCSKMRVGAGMIVYNAANEQGYAIKFHGDTSRVVEDFDGMLLICCPQSQTEEYCQEN